MRVIVVASRDGRELWRAELPHGTSPLHLMADAAWVPSAVPQVARDKAGSLVFHYEVSPILPGAAYESQDGRGSRPEVVSAASAGELALPVQRVAAYVVVWSARGLLATQYSQSTRMPGRWGLPGGGVESGEEPVRAAQRECWEETGQTVTVGQLLEVTSRHWIGRAPSGRLEDFHALGLVYAGTCTDPTTPRVHDVGGTTSGAAWVPPAQVATWPWATPHAGLAGAVAPSAAPTVEA